MANYTTDSKFEVPAILNCKHKDDIRQMLKDSKGDGQLDVDRFWQHIAEYFDRDKQG